VIAYIFQHRHDLHVLQKTFGNLLPFGIVRKIGEAKNLSLAGQGKLCVEGSPIDLISQLDAGKHDAVRVESIEQLLIELP